MPPHPLRAAYTLLMVLALAACGHSEPPPPAPPQVGVLTVHTQSVPLVRDFVGRLSSTRIAQVRARVTGIVLKRVYTEGTDVKAGDVLFRIDPAPLEATLRAQEGLLAQAEATAHTAELKAQRTREVAARGLISKQDLDDAIAAAGSAQAAVEAAKANVQNARINLGYATVTAPIDGRAGMANVTEGALVSTTDTNPLTTVQQLDPIYVEFSQPMVEVEQLRRAQANGDLQLAAPDQARVQVVLPDGSVYPRSGTLDFRDMAVDPATGAVSLRAIVPNPDHVLLPGMFVKLRLTLGLRHHAFQVPQEAVQRNADGAYLLTVGANDVVQSKRIVLDGQRGSEWVVENGLNDGDRVIVSGVQKVQPGAKVQPVAYAPDANTPAASAASSGD